MVLLESIENGNIVGELKQMIYYFLFKLRTTHFQNHMDINTHAPLLLHNLSNFVFY